MTELEKKLGKLNQIENELYSDLVNKYIRQKYSLSQELAILRQRDSKPEEFKAYNLYVEECKAKAKEELK